MNVLRYSYVTVRYGKATVRYDRVEYNKVW